MSNIAMRTVKTKENLWKFIKKYEDDIFALLLNLWYNHSVNHNTVQTLGGLNMAEKSKLQELGNSGTNGEETFRNGNSIASAHIIKGLKEAQILEVEPGAEINKHTHFHDCDIWLDISDKIAYVCLSGEDHELINNSSTTRYFLAIKSSYNYSYDEWKEKLSKLGFSVQHGSLIIN